MAGERGGAGRIDNRTDSWCPEHGGTMPCKKCSLEAEKKMIAESAARAKRASEPPEVAPKRESIESKPEIVRMKIGMMDSVRLGAFMGDLRKMGPHGKAAIEALRGAIVRMDTTKGVDTHTVPRTSEIRDLSHLPLNVRRLAERQRAQPARKEAPSEKPLSSEQDALFAAVMSLEPDMRKEVMDSLDVFIPKNKGIKNAG